ncbi:hypothetical protein [uncultured Aquimarina sp.]|uniref:hypothetical protein n=1 Tax=uncultured Aquimarina sp. TaxID=575652 RepID=UPI002605E25A|nr:hypothetical protein [uncultured Aquimarina sp.]
MIKPYLVLPIKLILISVSMNLASCQTKVKGEEITYLYKRIIEKSEPLEFTEIGLMINDTLTINKVNKGSLVFISQLQDTIEIDNKDSRFITGLIWINSGENKISKKQIDTFNISSNKLKDTIFTEFAFIPKYSGNNRIYIDIEENVFLHSPKYLRGKNNRLIKGSYEIDFPIYVKE